MGMLRCRGARRIPIDVVACFVEGFEQIRLPRLDAMVLRAVPCSMEVTTGQHCMAAGRALCVQHVTLCERRAARGERIEPWCFHHRIAVNLAAHALRTDRVRKIKDTVCVCVCGVFTQVMRQGMSNRERAIRQKCECGRVSATEF